MKLDEFTQLLEWIRQTLCWLVPNPNYDLSMSFYLLSVLRHDTTNDETVPELQE